MSQIIRTAIEEWVDDWVISENLCPFAKPVRQQGKMSIVVCEYASWSQVYDCLYQECQTLLATPSISTTLLVLSRTAEDFFDYLQLLEGADAVIDREGWRGIFQLASFHPDYLFQGEPPDSVTHYTNRSPLPVLHILREDEITQVTKSERTADTIVERNQQHMKTVGHQTAKAKLTHWRNRIASV